MSAFFEYLICKVCGVKIDAKDYTYEESQTGICEYCYEEKETLERGLYEGARIMKKTIYTIGHSTHSIEYFLDLLGRSQISMLCDVRSSPYSRIHPQFNRENLKLSLAEVGMSYDFFGAELGARSSDPRCYRYGKVQYSLLAESDLFKEGLDRFLGSIKEHRVALVCAEKDPIKCHRTILISRQLETFGLNIQHIHADGTLESHGDAILRLAHQLKLPENDLFRSRDEILSEAYRMQSERIAYSKKR